VLGINVGSLHKIVSLAGADDVVTIRAASDADKLSLIFRGTKECAFDLSLKALNSDTVKLPDTAAYKSSVTMHSGAFNHMCKELALVTNTLTIETDVDSVRFSVNGDIGAGTRTLVPNHGERVEERVQLDVKESVNMAYALGYLNLFSKASCLGDTVVLQMDPDGPMMLQYSFPLGEIKYFLAPRIMEEVS
jgi:proliferating cell nuclear antigen